MGSFGTHPAVRLAAIRKSYWHVMAVEGVEPRIETAVQQVWPFPSARVSADASFCVGA
jgi:hypothetical protein